MSVRRLAPLLLLIALLVAPIGRMGLAQAAAPGHGAPAAMAGHCDEMPAPGKTDRATVDCALACAAIATPMPSVPRLAATAPAAMHVPFGHRAFAGIHPEIATPPPRPL